MKFIALLLLFVSQFAGAVQFYEITSSHPLFRFIILAKDHETADQALEAFKNSIRKSDELMAVYTQEQLDNFKIFQSKAINASGLRPRVLVLANRGYDISNQEKDKSQQRVDRFYKNLKQQNDLIVLPVGMTARFTAKERQQFFKQMNDQFQGLLALGGADVDPDLYHAENEHAIDINSVRDRLEFEIIKSWLSFKKGFTFGVCRGHQMIAVAMGFKLAQHIENHGHEKFKNHAVRILSTTHNFLNELTAGDRAIVNSYHHQAVLAQAHPDVDIAAVSLDGTVEALESKDGRIFSTQFHYEFMTNLFSKNIFSKINFHLKRQLAARCQSLFF